MLHLGILYNSVSNRHTFMIAFFQVKQDLNSVEADSCLMQTECNTESAHAEKFLHHFSNPALSSYLS